MHILESYALTAGCKIGRCFIHEEPLVLPTNKYITFHPYSPKGSSKQYDYWHLVLKSLRENIKFDYEIIQIGEETDLKYDVNVSYLGQTSYSTLAYLIKHSALHLGFDSFPVHLASFYDKKIVAIYSYYANTCGPYFSKKDNVRILEPNFTKTKPIFNYDDPHRLINNIKYEDIYSAVLELLDEN